MAKQIIDSFTTKTPLTKTEIEYIEKIRSNPSSEEYKELWLAGVI